METNKEPLLVSIKAEDILLMQWNAEVEAGLNYIKYNADLDKRNFTEYEKYLNKEVEEEDDKILLESGENEKYYLQPGTYNVVFEMDGKMVETELVIEES